jgi:hypothetical protein
MEAVVRCPTWSRRTPKSSSAAVRTTLTSAAGPAARACGPSLRRSPGTQ